MIVEAKVLYDLQRGSYEEFLQTLNQTIIENQDKFGGDAVLFASFPDNAFVINGSGKFFKVGFRKNSDGTIKLGESVVLDVKTLSEDEVVGKSLDDFFSSGSLASGLRSIVNLQERIENGTPFEKAKVALAVLFSGGQIWRNQLSENKERISSFAWDANYGNLKLDIGPEFEKIVEGEVQDDSKEKVSKKLIALESRLFDCLSRAKNAYRHYQNKTISPHSEEADLIMGRFESFASDYFGHLSEISEFVSGSIRELNEGSCVICAALIHDEVAKRYKDLELGGRFIRKVSNQFTQ